MFKFSDLELRPHSSSYRLHKMTEDLQALTESQIKLKLRHARTLSTYMCTIDKNYIKYLVKCRTFPIKGCVCLDDK